MKHHEFPRFSHISSPVFGIQPMCRRPLVTYPVLRPRITAQNSYSHPPFGSLSRREIYRSPVASPSMTKLKFGVNAPSGSLLSAPVRRRGSRFPPPFGLSRPSLTGRFAPFPSLLSLPPSCLETILRRTSPAKKVSKFLATAKTTRTPRGIACDKGWIVGARRDEGEKRRRKNFITVVVFRNQETDWKEWKNRW